MSNKTKAILLIFLYSLIGGAIPSVTKIALLKIPAFSFSFMRFFISSIFLIPFFLKAKIKFDRDFISVILLSLLPTINVALFVLGVRLTTASISQFLYAGTTILAGIFGYLIFKNILSYKRWIFILIGLFGVLTVIFLPLIQRNSLFTGNLEGNLLIILAVISWSLYLVLSQKFQKKYSPVVITATFIFLATFIFFLLSIPELIVNSDWIYGLNSSSLYAILYVSLLATVGSYLINQYAIKYSNPVIASFAFYLAPIFGYISAYLLLGERLTGGLIIGTILVFISIALTTYTK